MFFCVVVVITDKGDIGWIESNEIDVIE